MAIWPGVKSFFSGGGDKRNPGYQSPAPAKYNKPAAASVDFDSAMGVSAFWACVRLLAETLASMPLELFEVSRDGNKTLKTDYDLWRLLQFSPNRYQTKIEFFETLMVNLVTWGNCYCVIQRAENTGRIISLLPLMSSQMCVEMLEDGTLVYKYQTNKGTNVYAASSIWHVKLFGNGVIGLSTLAYARQALGIAQATENRASVLAASGGKTNGILTIDKVLTKEQREAVRQSFNGLTDGPQDNLFVLEAGMNYQKAALSPSDMQLLETRRFEVEEICRFMGVPSVMVNDTSGTTAWGSGIQQIVEGFNKINMRPYLERFEASIKRHLMPTEDWGRYEFAFNFDSIVRGDIKTRMDAWRAGVNGAIYTPNEARRREGLPPMPGGDSIFLNGAMTPADQLPLKKG